MSAEQYSHKDVWSRSGSNFAVQVTRHSTSSIDDHEGPNRWAVYAYIYPKHPHFANFEGPAMWQDAAAQLHFHRGPSLLEYPMYEGKVTSVKVGADYHHLHDDRFTHYSTSKDAHEVFADADELFEQLQTRADVAKAAGEAS